MHDCRYDIGTFGARMGLLAILGCFALCSITSILFCRVVNKVYLYKEGTNFFAFLYLSPYIFFLVVSTLVPTRRSGSGSGARTRLTAPCSVVPKLRGVPLHPTTLGILELKDKNFCR